MVCCPWRKLELVHFVEKCMNQQETNLSEWKNPDNWSGPKWFVYISVRMTAVPGCRNGFPPWGWTINLGKNSGAYFLLGLLMGLPLLTIAVWVLADITK